MPHELSPSDSATRMLEKVLKDCPDHFRLEVEIDLHVHVTNALCENTAEIVENSLQAAVTLAVSALELGGIKEEELLKGVLDVFNFYITFSDPSSDPSFDLVCG